MMKPNAIMMVLPLVFVTLNIAEAADTQPTSDKADLKKIVVRATFAQEKGTQHITQREIQNRVTGNGTISEVLKSNLNVQFSHSANTSNTAGEISPENVSFHGEKFYNNNWMLDGLSNNDTTNPGADKGELSTDFDGARPWHLPAGGTQSFWINTGIIDRVDVYDSNISAKYGQFTGGVVDAKLKDANPSKASGRIEYRTTSDSYTWYHIEKGSDFYEAESILNQPRFLKRILSVNINQPLSKETAVLFSYNRTDSKIPFHHSYMNEWSNQERLSETFLLKGTHFADNGDKFNLTAIYSPHRSTYLKPNVKAGAVSNLGGGYRFNAEWQHMFDKARMDTFVGYKRTHNKIDSEAPDYYTYRHVAGLFDWCSNAKCTNSNYGGYGQFETGNATWTAKQDWTFSAMSLGSSQHVLSLGWQADFAQAWYRRDQATYLYGTSTAASTTQCQDGDNACFAGQFWFKTRTKYPASRVNVSNNHYAAYVQDKINWGRWEITPGVRIDHDQFLSKTNIAPRLTASWDLLGEQRTVLFGGLNRYYASSMLAYKLREATGASIAQKRTCSTCDWTGETVLKGTARRYYHRDVKTPYSDEINLGLQQKWGASVWTAKWVQRHGKDQFTRGKIEIDNVTYRTLTNQGRSRSDTFSIDARMTKPWRSKYASVTLSGGINYAKSQSSFDYYDDTLDDDPEMIIVEGQLRHIHDKPTMDYNNPWRMMLNVNTTFPRWRIVWTQTLNYTAGYAKWTSSTTYTCSSDVAACGTYTGKVKEYTKERFKNAFTYDWHLAWTLPTLRGQKLEITADISNVLNQKIKTKSLGSNTTTYKLGRQIWLGARYAW